MKDILSILINVIIVILIVRVWMIVARYIGEQLGISNLVKYILGKLKKKN